MSALKHIKHYFLLSNEVNLCFWLPEVNLCKILESVCQYTSLNLKAEIFVTQILGRDKYLSSAALPNLSKNNLACFYVTQSL